MYHDAGVFIWRYSHWLMKDMKWKEGDEKEMVGNVVEF